MVVVGFFGKYWKCIFLYRCFLYFGFDHRVAIMLSDFR